MEFLLEIMTEEMPYSHVKDAISQLNEKIEQKLNESHVKIEKFLTYGTCRRIIIWGDFAEEQDIKENKIIGPPKSAAFSKDGKPLPAAIGFVKSKGCQIEDLKVIKTERGEYVYVLKTERGKPTEVILKNSLTDIISSISFPKMMRWGSHSFRFSRPIKNIMCLFGGKTIPFSMGNIKASNFSTGHKILSPQKFKVDSLSNFKEMLKKRKVEIDPDARKKMIINQMKKQLKSLNAQIYPDDTLMDALIYDVEYPYVFLGSFSEEYLKLPLEIISTAMKEGQKLFSVLRDKKQIPYFLGIADTFKDDKKYIQNGNERVLKARLEDARFFWEKDRMESMKEKSKRLSHVVYQEKLGSYEQKTTRIKKIANYIGRKSDIKINKNELSQAAELCKVDLLTEMVREFSSLQGKVGGLYVREEGYPDSVWKAIYEHYDPVSLENESPSSLNGAILSLADKIDSIVGQIGIGIEVKGSKDPFGLRRMAQSMCKVILDKKISLSIGRLIDKVYTVYEDLLSESKENIKEHLITEFFPDRLQYIFEEKGYRYDLIWAALGSGIDNIFHTYLRVKALEELKESAHLEPMIMIAKRVNNILRNQPRFKFNPERMIEKEERELYTTISIIKENILPLIARGEFEKAQRIVFRVKSVIHKFFDNVMVMTEEQEVMQNRLALLQEISRILLKVADYSKIVVKGK